jgi:hypothetical protein
MKHLPKSTKQGTVARIATWLPLIAVVGILGVGCGGRKAAIPVAAWGTKAKYVEDEKVKFPDFTLRFKGTSQEKDKNFPSGVTVYTFRVRKGDERRTVKWAATSKPEPLKFKFQDGHYSLELVNSQKLGKLADDEVVVWKLDKN